MWTLICIVIVGYMAYNCRANFLTYIQRGSRRFVDLDIYLSMSSLLGYPIWYALTIWSFWHYDWWIPIVAYLTTFFTAGFTAILFQRNFIGALLSPLILIIFTTLSVINLL